MLGPCLPNPSSATDANECFLVGRPAAEELARVVHSGDELQRAQRDVAVRTGLHSIMLDKSHNSHCAGAPTATCFSHSEVRGADSSTVNIEWCPRQRPWL